MTNNPEDVLNKAIEAAKAAAEAKAGRVNWETAMASDFVEAAVDAALSVLQQSGGRDE